jgi:hypothetical protein
MKTLETISPDGSRSNARVNNRRQTELCHHRANSPSGSPGHFKVPNAGPALPTPNPMRVTLRLGSAPHTADYYQLIRLRPASFPIHRVNRWTPTNARLAHRSPRLHPGRNQSANPFQHTAHSPALPRRSSREFAVIVRPQPSQAEKASPGTTTTIEAGTINRPRPSAKLYSRISHLLTA